MENTNFVVNHYGNLKAQSYKGSEAFTFDDLVKYLEYSTVSSNKYEGGLFILGEMSDSHRNDSNIINKHCLVIDYDDLAPGTDLPQIIKDKFKASYILFSTHNHTNDNPRLRLVIPLSKPLQNEYYKYAIDEIDKVLGVTCDQSCKALSQAQARQVLKSEQSHRVFEYSKTTLLNTDTLIKAIEHNTPKNDFSFSVNPPKRDVSWWSSICYGVGKGQRNSSLASITGLLLYRGVPIEAVTGLLWCWNQSNDEPMTDKEFQTTLDSIIRTHIKGGGKIITYDTKTEAN
ncbi:primase C-terminal domain-containing protein [Macrococcoides goetzii]|uniref:primase C-terminal domain-containing protein n=1 Tax=Macrococcus sp. PK TaxID=2801919 RepID=UPI001F0F430F|nr:primase C-terminal domain-containing protein [Macrococcus sp. PK]MCH4985347.1 primase C-terminal domain-containing protein [Macrococcus sp. PK]